MSGKFRIFLMAALFAVLPSCKAISSLIHDGEVVARLGDHKLYRSELDDMIPKGTSPEDSVKLAGIYINSWARDKAFVDIAQQRLSKGEKDVSKELEAYRQSLLRYRYEQRYINERLDTTVSRKQIEEYYDSHQESFKLERPIMKARFLNISKDSPNLAFSKKEDGETKYFVYNKKEYSSFSGCAPPVRPLPGSYHWQFFLPYNCRHPFWKSE